MAFSFGKKKEEPPKPPSGADSGQAGAAPAPAKTPAIKAASPFSKKQKKQKKPATLKPISAFVLTIGDDGAILMQMIKGKAEGRWFAPDPSADHQEVFTRSMKAHPELPLYILLDTMDQSYVMQTLPPVRSVGSLMKRRLNREFPNAEIKGAILMGREGAKKEWVCQMIAAEKTEAIGTWFNWVQTMPNPCKGIRLVPLEMAEVMKQLCLRSKDDPSHTHPWLYLFSHHKVSGFRQVILKEGKMVFTRIGQPLQGASDVIAGLVEQEINTTVEYLKRLGLKDPDSLHMHLIASQDIVQLVDGQRANVRSTRVTTPHQAAEIFGLEGATQATDRYGDMVISGVIARLPKATLSLSVKSFQQTMKLSAIAKGLKLLTIAAILGATCYAGSQAYDIWNTMNEKEQLQDKHNQLSKELEAAKQDSKAVENMDTMKDVMEVYTLLQSVEKQPEDFLIRFSKAYVGLKDTVTVKNIKWGFDSELAIKGLPTTPKLKDVVEINFTLADRGEKTDEEIQQQTNAILETFKSAFTDYTLTMSSIEGIKTEKDTVNLDYSGATVVDKARQIGFSISFKANDPGAQQARGTP